MKWHHINTIKYLCTNLNINKIIIDKKTNSSSLSESHFNWLSFFSSTNFSQAVNCFKALRISVRSCSTSGQTLLSFFSILLSFQKVGWIGLYTLFHLYCFRCGSQDDNNLGMMGMGANLCAL